MPPKPINGFADELSYRAFLADLVDAADRGEYREIPPDPDYGPRMIYGGRWFEHRQSGQIWRLVAPQAPFMGLWERVLRADRQRVAERRQPVKHAEPV